jgi:hypothetical protein
MGSSNGSEETTLKLSMSIGSRQDRIASMASASIKRTMRTVTPSLWSSKALRTAGASRSLSGQELVLLLVLKARFA